MPRRVRQTIVVRPSLNIGDAERIARSLSVTRLESDIVVDFTQCRAIQPGAGWRLANALRITRSLERLDVIVPDESSDPTGSLTEQWLALRSTGVAKAIATRARRIRTESGRVIGTRAREAWKAAVVSQQRRFTIDNLVTAAIDEDENVFQAQFDQWVEEVARGNHLGFDPGDTKAVGKLTYEAIFNVRDHASSKPLPPDTEVLSHLAISYFPASDFRRDFVPDDFVDYLSRVGRPTATHTVTGYLHITVSDDGVGVAARHSQEPSIYAGELVEEDTHLTLAMTAGSSIKPITRDAPFRGDPGYGYSHIASTLTKLEAYAIVRTGRRRLVCDGSVSDPGYAIDETVQPLLPGTVLDLLIPIRDPQGRLLTDQPV